jgi:hypothetical protein
LITALVTVSALLIGVVGFVFDVVLDRSAALIAGIAFAVIVLALWVVGPAVLRVRSGTEVTR